MEASLHRARTSEKLPAELAKLLGVEVLALLDSCTTRSRRLVSDEDWKRIERRGALRIHFPERLAHATPQKPDLHLREVLLPLGEDPESRQIFVRDGELTFSPFVGFDQDLYRRIQQRVEGR